MKNELQIISLIDSFYDIISGKATEKRDWNAFRKLFYTNAHIMSTRYNSENKCISIPKDIDTYITTLTKFLDEVDFYEYGLNYNVEIYGNLAQVYSEYEAKNHKEDLELIKRGINLVQAINDGESWKILSMVWNTEILK